MTDLEDRVRASLTWHVEHTTFDDVPPAGVEPQPERNRALLPAARLLVAVAIAGTWLAVRSNDTSSPTIDTAAPVTTLTTATTVAQPTTSAPATPAPPTSVVLDPTSMWDSLGLPDGWSVASVDVQHITEPGQDGTRQLFGTVAGDGVSLQPVIEVTILKYPDMTTSEPVWSTRFWGPVDGSWHVGGSNYLVTAQGMDIAAASAFTASLVLRSTDPFAGFDAPPGPIALIEEHIGTGRPSPTEDWLTLHLAGPDGATADVGLTTRSSITTSLGTGFDRVRIGDRIATIGPEPFPGDAAMVDWAGVGVQYRVSTESGLATAVRLGESIDRLGDERWVHLIAAAVAAAPEAGTIPAEMGGNVFAFGESVMAGAAQALTQANIKVDAKENRQAGSLLIDIGAARSTGIAIGTVVIQIGTNGPVSSDTYRRILDELVDVPRVVLLTVSAPRDWIAPNNALIRSLAGEYPNVVVADWEAVALANHNEMSASDGGIHLNSQTAINLYAELIDQAIR